MVRKHKDAKQLRRGFRVIGIQFDSVLHQVDGILIAMLLHQYHRHRAGQGN